MNIKYHQEKSYWVIFNKLTLITQISRNRQIHEGTLVTCIFQNVKDFGFIIVSLINTKMTWVRKNKIFSKIDIVYRKPP